ncbi:MAG: DUF1254 domain-containing protein [Pseudomonadota bacterium]
MSKLFGPALFGLLLAAASHFSVVHFAPGFIMDRAMSMLEGRGAELHKFHLAERTTPQSQSVVRASPDLAYSVCLFDFDQAGSELWVKMAATEDYASLSFFDDQTNNFKTIRGEGQGIAVKLLSPEMPAKNENSLVSPSMKGLILIRRLAPTVEDYRRVSAIAENDSCRSVDG